MKRSDRESVGGPHGSAGGSPGEDAAVMEGKKGGGSESEPVAPTEVVKKPSRGLRLLGWFFVLLLAGGVTLLFLHRPEQTGPAGPHPAGGFRSEMPTPVRATPVELGTITVRAAYPGQLETDLVDVTPDVSGRLTAVHVRIGDRVEVGQEVAHLDDTEWRLQLDEAEAQVEAAEAAQRRALAQREGSRRELERTGALADDQIVSVQEVDSLQARLEALEAEADAAAAQRAQARARIAILRQQLSDCSVEAPFSGTVSDRYRDPGAFVATGSPIIRLVADGPLHVIFSVPEAEIGRIAMGTSITARTAATGDLEVTGSVVGMAREVVPEQRIVRVEGQLDNAPDAWLPGMYTEVHAVQRILRDVQVIPARAVLTRVADGGQEVSGIFQVELDRARWTPIRVLGREGDRVAVEGSADSGTLVLVSGHEDLHDGAAITVVTAMEGSR